MTCGADDVDLAEEEGRAGVALFGLGGAVAGGAAFDDVGDVDLFALETHGGDHVVEQLAGFADEGNALRVFVGAGAFTDEHKARVWGAVGEDELVAAGVEGAAGAVADIFADELEGGGAVGGGGDGGCGAE